MLLKQLLNNENFNNVAYPVFISFILNLNSFKILNFFSNFFFLFDLRLVCNILLLSIALGEIISPPPPKELSNKISKFITTSGKCNKIRLKLTKHILIFYWTMKVYSFIHYPNKVIMVMIMMISLVLITDYYLNETAAGHQPLIRAEEYQGKTHKPHRF